MPLMAEISLEIDLTDPVYTHIWTLVTCPSENNFAEYQTVSEILLAKSMVTIHYIASMID